MKAAPRFLLFGCGHRIELRHGTEMRRCPKCRDRRVTADDRRTAALTAEIRAAEERRTRRVSALVAHARRRDEDLPLTAWAGR